MFILQSNIYSFGNNSIMPEQSRSYFRKPNSKRVSKFKYQVLQDDFHNSGKRQSLTLKVNYALKKYSTYTPDTVLPSLLTCFFSFNNLQVFWTQGLGN